MEINKHLVWHILFHVGMGIVVLWLILKSFGIIKTPFWLEYGLPGAGVVLGIFALYYNLIQDIHKISTGLLVLTTRFDHLENTVHQVGGKVDRLEDDMRIGKIKLN